MADIALDKLVGITNNLASTVGDLAVKTDNLVTTIDDLAVAMKNGFDHLDHKIDTFRAESRKEICGVESRLTGEINSVRSDIRRLEASLDEIKERLTKLEKRSFEDDEVLAKEVVDLRKRVDFLEGQMKKLKIA